MNKYRHAESIPDSHPGTPLFPISVYFIDHNGRYGAPIMIFSEEQLHGPGMKLVLRSAMERKEEVIFTDPGDLTIFHMKDGKILFPPTE